MAFELGTSNTTLTTVSGDGGDLAAAIAIASGAPWPDGGAGENDRITVTITKGAQSLTFTQAEFAAVTASLQLWDEEPA